MDLIIIIIEISPVIITGICDTSNFLIYTYKISYFGSIYKLIQS